MSNGCAFDHWQLFRMRKKKSFVDVAGLDPQIKPGDNFFRYVNGRWYDTAKIASDQSGVGSYSFMNIPQKKLLQNILDSVSKAKNTMRSIEQQVGDFYESGMDLATINKRGYQPVKPILERIDAINSTASLLRFVATEFKSGNRSIISFGVSPDNKNSGINIAHVYQGGIGLPDRDYYFKTDSATLHVQQALPAIYPHLISTDRQQRCRSRTMDAATAYSIEKMLAAAHKTNVELRDVDANYHKLPVIPLGKTQPNIGWETLLANLGALTDSVDVAQPAYYNKLDTLLKTIPLDQWKIYIKAFTLENYAETLSQSFVDASFEFNKALSGQATQKPRRQIMTEQVDNYLGEALGQLYVKRYFNEDAKKRVLTLVNNLQKSFENRINQLDWMSDSTKQKAREKLYAITKNIGYPDKWRDYSKAEIKRTAYFENIIALSQNDYRFQLEQLNKPVDKTQWGLDPATVTAYYNPSVNKIVFPAGILQYPYFDFSADDAIIYGGIGMVIGHEDDPCL